LVPNFFSPNNDNINDEWKVSHQSLTQFECWIFDKAGKQVFHFNDPSEGWNGKINGRSVKSGVFYYVIKAVGADKKIYDLSGDINIISSTQKSQTY
ncbi:MAG: gliding motility-associated C-terminal domain-containing protein, partial [Muribaculaceae bacterium]|nr:gliding motility-associated C-terminal domain-containing protein [Muribaculaceae bacterium]